MSASAKWIEGIGPTSTVDDAARRSLEPRLAQVMHLLPMAAYLAEHDIEHVHRLRVATRRATAALKLYETCLPHKSHRWMKKRLRKIRRAVGYARDLDVLSDRLTREYGDAVAPVIELVAATRTAVQPAIRRVAERCSHNDRLATKTAKLLHQIKFTQAHEPTDQGTDFREWASPQFSKVANEFVAALPQPSFTTVELHQFRIRTKALRYVIELVASALGEDLRKKLYPIVEDLQEHLGAIQDHVAAIDRCNTWSAEPRNEVLTETLRELIEAERRGLADSINKFRAWWSEDRAMRVRELLNTTPAITGRPATAPQMSPID
jgi:CHAD domain-containing protein